MTCQPEHRDGYVPQYNVRTDLALEAREVVQTNTAADIPGVVADTVHEEGISISRIRIETADAARRLGKVQGNYITLEAPGLRRKDSDLQDSLSEMLSRELLNIIPLSPGLEESVLVVGLGNWNVTPDALGPRVIEDLLVTRHLFELNESVLGKGFRSVCAISPGVMGITGIETGETIGALVSRINPAVVIAVDALAAHRLERLHTTVQISDSGINPGSGVGNNRLGINRQTLGVPVVAIGVPTVVDASTIAGEAMDALVESFKREAQATGELATALDNLSWEERQVMIREVLEPFSSGRLIVTPKEIDTFVEDISAVVSSALNATLHPRINSEESGKYLQ